MSQSQQTIRRRPQSQAQQAASETGTGEDATKLLADKLRGGRGVRHGEAVFRANRVDYFRGKDLVRYFKDNTDQLRSVLTLTEGRSVDSLVQEFANELLKRNLIVRAERFFKKPKPGKKRLVKFPKKLADCQEQRWDEEGFFFWTYAKPTSPWTYVWSALLVFGIIAACFFPMAPYWVKVVVLYLSLFILGAFAVIFIVRFALFFPLWVALGWEFWLFPNITNDQAGFFDAFIPLYSFQKHQGSIWQQLARGGSVIVMGALVYILLLYTPDASEISKGAFDAHDAIFDLFNMTSPRQALGGTGVDESAAQAEPEKKVREDGLPEYEGDDDDYEPEVDLDKLSDLEAESEKLDPEEFDVPNASPDGNKAEGPVEVDEDDVTFDADDEVVIDDTDFATPGKAEQGGERDSVEAQASQDGGQQAPGDSQSAGNGEVGNAATDSVEL